MRTGIPVFSHVLTGIAGHPSGGQSARLIRLKSSVDIIELAIVYVLKRVRRCSVKYVMLCFSNCAIVELDCSCVYCQYVHQNGRLRIVYPEDCEIVFSFAMIRFLVLLKIQLVEKEPAKKYNLRLRRSSMQCWTKKPTTAIDVQKRNGWSR